GNFSAGTITANLVGNVTGNVSGTATNVSGVVAVANGGTGLSSIGNNMVLVTNASGTVAPAAISADTFTQYALLAGRAGGQTLRGGTDSGNTLTLESTSHATKGALVL